MGNKAVYSFSFVLSFQCLHNQNCQIHEEF
jgi:hypothetical protein